MVKGIPDRTSRQREETVERWSTSGLSQAEFCRREGLRPWLLSDWKKQIEARKQRKSGGAIKRARRTSKRDQETESHWRKLIAEQRASGLGVRVFCSQQNVAMSTFCRWKKFFEKVDSHAHVQNKPIASNPFVELKSQSFEKVKPSAIEAFLEVLLPNGAKVRVTEHTSLELLSKVLKALEVTC